MVFLPSFSFEKQFLKSTWMSGMNLFYATFCQVFMKKRDWNHHGYQFTYLSALKQGLSWWYRFSNFSQIFCTTKKKKKKFLFIASKKWFDILWSSWLPMVMHFFEFRPNNIALLCLYSTVNTEILTPLDTIWHSKFGIDNFLFFTFLITVSDSLSDSLSHTDMWTISLHQDTNTKHM